jgi:hypothetical protein
MMDWRFGLARFCERNVDGFVTIQPDWYGGENGDEDDGGGEALEVIHPYGFRSQPRDPDIDPETKTAKGAGLLYVFDGDEGFALPTQDPRDAGLLEDEGKGGAQMYAVTNAGAVSRVFMAGSTGNITIQFGSDATITLTSTGIVLTGTGGSPAALAKAAELQSFATSVVASVNAIAAYINAIAPGTVPPVAALAGTVATTKVQGA